MKVTISKFRCYRHSSSFDFPLSSLSLLKGNSGAGKSTLFEAIKWCLYGGMQHILPSGSDAKPNEPTSVEIVFPELGEITITRTKPPEVVTFSVPGYAILTGDSAQAYIEAVLGKYSIFSATSYLSQSERSALMTLPNNKKMDLLQELTFGSVLDLSGPESPEFYLETLDKSLSSSKTLISELTGKFNGGLESLTRQAQSNGPDLIRWNQYLETQNESDSSRLLILLKKKFEMKTLTLNQLRDELMIDKERNGTRISLNSALQKIGERLFSISVSFPRLSVEKLEEQKRDYLLLTQYQKLVSEIEALSERVREVEGHSSLSISDELNELRRGSALCQQLGISYSESEIANSLNQIQIHIENNETLIRKRKEYEEACSRYSAYSNLISALEKMEREELGLVQRKVTQAELEVERERKRYDENLQNQELIKEKRVLVLSEITQLEINILSKKEELIQRENEISTDQLVLAGQEMNKVSSELSEFESTFQSQLNFLSNHGKELKLQNSPSIHLLLERISQHHLNVLAGLRCPSCQERVTLSNGKLELDILTDETKKFSSEMIERCQEVELQLSVLDKKREKLNEVKKIYLIEEGKVKEKREELAQFANSISEIERVLLQKQRELNQFDSLLSGKELVEIERRINEALNKVELAKSEVKNVEEKILMQRKTIDSTFPTLPLSPQQLEAEPLAPEMVKHLQELSQALRTLRIVPRTEAELTRLLSNLELVPKFNQLNEEKRRVELLLPSDRESLSHLDLSKIENEINLIKSLTLEHEHLTKEKERIERELLMIPMSRIDELTVKISELESELLELQSLLKAGQVYQQLSSERESLEKIQKEVLAQGEREAGLNRLKVLVTEVMSHALLEIVDALNLSINEILRDIFDEEITIILSLFKQLKTKDQTRNQVNMQISHRGNLYDSPNHLSGGEKDRLSLALTIALSQIGGSPLLMLDESMASLDGALRELCTKTIRKYLPNKTVINVCHETIEGFHDKVVTV